MKPALSISTAAARAPIAFKDVAAEETHIIRTQRLTMRPASHSDFDDYVKLLSDPAVMKYVGLETGKVLNRKKITHVLQTALDGWAERGWGRWSIFDHNGEFIGFCGFRMEQGQPELIALIHKRYWNQDITPEAAFACIEYGRKVFGFGEIKAFTHPKNLRARRLLDKLGAYYEGDVDFHGILGSEYTLHQVARAAV